MEKEFILYEQALALKELGFDKPVEFYKTNSEELFDMRTPDDAPCILWQQAFRWFREKHKLVIEPCIPFQTQYLTEEDDFEILEFGYRIYSFDQYRGGLRNKIELSGYDNEEEAELECLNKLIEIVKNK